MANLIEESSKSRIDIKNIKDLNTILVDRKFGRPEDYIEVFITDLNDTILSTIPNFTEYTSGENTQGLVDEINIDVLSVLNNQGFNSGTYKLYANIQKRKIFNTTTPPFSIKEISPSKTELKLRTTEGNTRLDTNSRTFISQIQNSTYFRDFTLNLGNNVNLTAVNIELDSSNPNEFLLSIKLLKPLPGNIKEGDKLTLVEDITEPIVMTYNLGSLPPIESTTLLKGPNFKIDTRLNSSLPSAFKSYDDILTTETTSSYQKLLSKLDGYEIPEVDYSYIKPIHSASIGFETVTPSHFENFVHFGNAGELLKNFEYKLKLIELYDNQLTELNNIPGTTSTITTDASSSVLNKKETIIQGFSGYEQFLYFTSGSNTYTWPKTTSTEPYLLSPTTSTTAKTWLGSENYTNTYYGGQLLSASIFDRQNPNRLFKLTPAFIGDKEENKPYELFCDMVGQHFDPIWTHIKEFTQIRDNSHTMGVSKNLVYYALQSLGIDTLDQFENEDLVDYIFGKPSTPSDISTMVSASSEIMSKEDMTKEVWKRLYHNAPYLLKTKGTERGLRALINCYGIPSTILDIKEFGSSSPIKDDVKLYTYDKFTQVLTGDSLDGTKRGMFIETEWSSSNTRVLSSSKKTVEFRIKPTRNDSPLKLDKRQHLFSLTSNIANSVSSSDIHLIIQPYTGSDDFYTTNDRTNFGRLELQQFTESISNTEYFNIYNGDFWDVTLSTDGISGSNSTLNYGAYQANHLRDVLHHTQSISISEKVNAESFGNPYYNAGIHGTSKAFIGGIKNTLFGGNITSSIYTNNVTSSFDLGFEGSISEIRYYFGEQLSHKTLQLHALEPLMYGGNSISSSYDHLILRYPLSFELSIPPETNNQLPSSSYAWNVSPTSPLVGPITGGVILSSSGYPSTGSALTNYSGQPFSSSGAFVYPPSGSNIPVFTVAGTPLLPSHHPNQTVNYLNGFTYFDDKDVELIVETHHIPTPNTIGKSPINRKVYIDKGTTDDDILSPDILSRLPSTERQVPDFSNIGIYLSPQNEVNEDIIYTLGTFSLDEFLGDPREETSGEYTSFKPLIDQYFKKLEKGKDRYNIWDFTRWMQFLDHTLFDLIKQFVPQKSTTKTGLLIEPHFLERTKFKRYHPIINRPEYNGTIQEVTQSFSKNSNRSQLDNTTGSAVLSQYNFIGTGSDGKALGSGYDTNIDVANALAASSTWEQGPIQPARGPELLANGTFTNNHGWHITASYGNDPSWIIGGGVAQAGQGTDFGTMTHSASIFEGHTYEIIYDVTVADTTGTGQLILANHTDVGGANSNVHLIGEQEVGTYSVQWVQGAALAGKIRLYNNSNFDGSIDNISVKEVIINGSNNEVRSSVGSNELRPWALTPRGNFLNSKVSKIKFKSYPSPELIINGDFTNGSSNWTLNGAPNGWTWNTAGTIVGTTVTQNYKINQSYLPLNTFKVGTEYEIKVSISNYIAGNVNIALYNEDGKGFLISSFSGNGDYTFKRTVGTGNTSTTGYWSRFWIQAYTTFTGDIDNISIKEVQENIKENVEFDDALIDSAVWKRSRYEGSKLTGAKINEYTAGDITYGLNPVVEQNTTALYFGKSLTSADGIEDDNLATIKNHSYIDIEKIILIDKYDDSITSIDLKNENFKGINGYIAKDFKNGSSFNIELLDSKIKHKLKDTYKAKFNQGYLYKIVEHKGVGNSEGVNGQGIQVGYIDSSSHAFSEQNTTGSLQNWFVYGRHSNVMNSDTLTLKSNTLTKKIWPQENAFGLVDFITSSGHYVYNNMTSLSSFYNSILIPVASESQYRLFGTVQLGQSTNVADYLAETDAGIRNISTFELDLKKYNVTSSGTLNSMHTLISSSANMSGFGKPLLQPNTFAIPIMQGPHDIITTKKVGTGITWPANGGNVGSFSAAAKGRIQLQKYFHGESYASAIYQISYLEETNTLIANIDKSIELANDVGGEGYILIPDNIDKEISDNLDFYLDKAGLKENSKAKKSPPRGR